MRSTGKPPFTAQQSFSSGRKWAVWDDTSSGVAIAMCATREDAVAVARALNIVEGEMSPEVATHAAERLAQVRG